MSKHDDYSQGDGLSRDRDVERRQNEFQDDDWLSLEIYVKANQSELLQGLDQWLQLNLISQAQVKKVCRQNLSCALPAVKIAQANIEPRENALPIAEQTLVKVDLQPNLVTRIWQSFLDELSIRWLLFLGIFLVVVSSGAFAASQWDNVPRLGQYLILFIYTLSFWGIGFWASGQNQLTLTSQTLRAIATLLVPINFWAISHFGLGNNVLEWITLIVALITLTGVIYFQFRQLKEHYLKYFLPLFLLLSYLHLGWHLAWLPITAVYSGVVIIVWLHYQILLPQEKYDPVNLLFLFATWSLLLTRSLLFELDLIVNYALAIALFAWLLATIYLTRTRQIQIALPDQQLKPEQINNTFLGKIFFTISSILLTVTWGISIAGGIFNSELYFWQTVAISILTLNLFSQRLTLNWRKRDLTAIFLIGLQTLYISKELIPSNLRNNALDLAVTISKTEYLPESVFSVTLFPYLIVFVLLASWLYRRQKSELAIYAEYLTLSLGMVLTYLSFYNPTWRSLNLLFSTLTLGYVAWIRQPVRTTLIYFTHLLGLVTMINAIAVILPNLSQSVWGSILVLLMAGEWGIYIYLTKKPRIKFKSNFLVILSQSCWYAGLILGGVSYNFFLRQIAPNNFPWGAIWLITPVMLTLVAKYTRKIQQRRLATILSCVALITAQLLIFGQWETMFIGLAVAIGLMFQNAFHLRRTFVTIVHLGFGLSLIPSLLYSLINGWNWLLIGVVTLLGLYQLRRYLQQIITTPKFDYISQRFAKGILGVGVETKNFKLIGKYILAADYWAIALIASEVAILSAIYSNLVEFSNYTLYLLITSLLLGAIIWRYRRQPNNLVLYTVAWLGELLVAGIIMLLGGNDLTLAVVNIILGLSALGLISWLDQTESPWAELNLTYMPLLYGVLSVLWRSHSYNSYTGLLTLGVAWILITSKQNQPQINLVTNYLGFGAISLGSYELVIYQMQQSSGESAADGLTILALVAAAIAFCYRLGAWWHRQNQKTTMFNLSLSRVILIAHLHWAMSSILKILAASIAINTTPRLTLISIATSFCLGAYALIQGKDREIDPAKPDNDWWVYVGLVEIVATVVYSRLIISKLSLFDPWRVIFTCAVALAIYQIPWQNLGWRATPWQRAALITPALMALVTAEDISYFSLIITAVFYLRIAYAQQNIRWSYLSLGLINWGVIRLVWQYNTEFIWLAAIMSLSVLYIAQFDPYWQSNIQKRHYLRLVGSSVLCVAGLFYQELGIIPGAISFSLIFVGLGLRIRAFLFTGTITLILTAIYQLVALVIAYSFLKWIVGLLAGICSIIIAAGFERQRDRVNHKFQSYISKLKDWQ